MNFHCDQPWHNCDYYRAMEPHGNAEGSANWTVWQPFKSVCLGWATICMHSQSPPTWRHFNDWNTRESILRHLHTEQYGWQDCNPVHCTVHSRTNKEFSRGSTCCSPTNSSSSNCMNLLTLQWISFSRSMFGQLDGEATLLPPFSLAVGRRARAFSASNCTWLSQWTHFQPQQSNIAESGGPHRRHSYLCVCWEPTRICWHLHDLSPHTLTGDAPAGCWYWIDLEELPSLHLLKNGSTSGCLFIVIQVRIRLLKSNKLSSA